MRGRAHAGGEGGGGGGSGAGGGGVGSWGQRDGAVSRTDVCMLGQALLEAGVGGEPRGGEEAATGLWEERAAMEVGVWEGAAAFLPFLTHCRPPSFEPCVTCVRFGGNSLCL